MIESAEPSSTRLVSIVVPMITLVAIFAIDSIGENEGFIYRAFVGGASIFSLIPACVILLEAPIQEILGIQLDSHLHYLLLSAAGMSLLVIGCTVVEVSRGLDDDLRSLGIVISSVLGSAFLAFGIMLVI